MKIEVAVKEYLVEIEVRKFTKKTIRSYRNNLNLFLRFCQEEADVFDMEDLTLAVIRKFTLFMTGRGRKGSYMGELSCKVWLLEDIPSPRIILLGGSAVAFGVDSTLMERELKGFHVVNFGMYAAIGTTVMLDLSESHQRDGDIVIVIPEQSAQTLSDSFDPSVMWQGLDGAPGLLADLPRDKVGKLLGAFPSFSAKKLGYILSASKPEPTGVYRRASFNGHGDISVPCI